MDRGALAQRRLRTTDLTLCSILKYGNPTCGYIAIKSDTDIYGLQKINTNVFGDALTFSLGLVLDTILVVH